MKKHLIKFLGGFTQDEVKEIKNENFLLHENQKRLEILFENISRYKGTYPACKAYNEFIEVVYHNDKYLSDYVEEYLRKLCTSFIIYFKCKGDHQAVEYWERMGCFDLKNGLSDTSMQSLVIQGFYSKNRFQN